MFFFCDDNLRDQSFPWSPDEELLEGLCCLPAAWINIRPSPCFGPEVPKAKCVWSLSPAHSPCSFLFLLVLIQPSLKEENDWPYVCCDNWGAVKTKGSQELQLLVESWVRDEWCPFSKSLWCPEGKSWIIIRQNLLLIIVHLYTTTGSIVFGKTSLIQL